MTEPRLLDMTRDTLRRKHYSLRTEESYLRWIRQYILFNGKRHPREMGAPELEAFLTHLAIHRKVSASTQNQALSAILFLTGMSSTVIHSTSWSTPSVPNDPSGSLRFSAGRRSSGCSPA